MGEKISGLYALWDAFFMRSEKRVRVPHVRPPRAGVRGPIKIGSSPLEYYAGNVVHFEHQDRLGTERTHTSYNGSVEATLRVKKNPTCDATMNSRMRE